MNEHFRFAVLSGNQLKLIALISMTVDHIGVMLFPDLYVLRIIGRIAYPIFAFMIAEGCFYTKHKTRYFFEVLGIGVLCQVAYFILYGSLELNIMLGFSFSILIIFAIQKAKETRGTWQTILAITLIGAAWVSSALLPEYIKGFRFDYGFVGIVLPVIVYIIPYFRLKIVAFAITLFVLATTLYFPLQIWGLMAVPLMMLYTGKRGKIKMGQFFYIYYPAHMVAIWAIGEMAGAFT